MHHATSSTALLGRRTAAAGAVLACASLLLLSVTPGAAGAAGNLDCPAGTTAYKIEPVKAGTYPLGTYSVTLSSVLESTFVWTASAPVHTLIVKGGSLDAVLTTLPAGTTSGTGTAPLSPSGNGQLAGLSNVTFCFGSGSVVSASVSPSPSLSPSLSPSPSVSPSASVSPSPSTSPTVSSSPSVSPSASVSPTVSPSPSSSVTPSASGTPAATTSPAGSSSPPTASTSPLPSPSDLRGVVDQPATGGGGVAAPVPGGPARPILGGSAPLPATAPLPSAAPGGAAAPGALPTTGAPLRAAVATGLLLVVLGIALNVVGRRRPTHAVPGFWSL